jgi:hypothetical protein
LASAKTHQNGGFIRGKTPPDTRHQTPSTHQTPNTVDTPDTRHQKLEDDLKKKMKDDLKKVKMEDIFEN